MSTLLLRAVDEKLSVVPVETVPVFVIASAMLARQRNKSLNTHRGRSVVIY